MPGSGAGMNRIGQQGAVTLLANITANATPFTSDPRTAYGAIGFNDSGLCLLEGMGFTKGTFQLLQTRNLTVPTGYTALIMGTVDPVAYQAWQPANWGPGTNGPRGSTIVPPANWFALPAPSEQGSTGNVQNPLYDLGQVCNISLPIVAVRAVLIAVSGSAAGVINVGGFLVP